MASKRKYLMELAFFPEAVICINFVFSNGILIYLWNAEMERSSEWLPWPSLGTLKTSFNVPSDDQGSHPDDLSVSVKKWALRCCCCLMMTSSNGNIFRVTGPLCGEFTGPGEFPAQRPVTGSCDVFFDLRLNKRFSKQSWGWWFETSSWSLWCQCNVEN